MCPRLVLSHSWNTISSMFVQSYSHSTSKNCSYFSGSPHFIQCQVRSWLLFIESQAVSFLVSWPQKFIGLQKKLFLETPLVWVFNYDVEDLNIWLFPRKRFVINLLCSNCLLFLYFTTAEEWNIWDFHTYSYPMSIYPQNITKFMLFIEILMTLFYIFGTDFKPARSPYISYKRFVPPPPQPSFEWNRSSNFHKIFVKSYIRTYLLRTYVEVIRIT